MSIVSIDFTKNIGKIKPMHAVNNGPIKGSSTHQSRSNFEAYKEAGIPYARNHDASFCSGYGGEHTVDVHFIFPDFTKNPHDPESYDFAYTDDYISITEEAGTRTFYRLGTKIEHGRKKYGTIVPADFHKWAVICEHIIRHYTQGWANGFYFDLEYWEIWNEADGKEGDDQPNWSGTPQEYYELYAVTAKHLKSRFPKLKIGGPALSWLKNTEWLDGFLAYLTKDGDKVPMDFFSWHMYDDNPRKVAEGASFVKGKLDAAGYTEAENILNEYNYLENWTDKFVSSIEAIIGMRGAAFTAAAMLAGQGSDLDMLMYYDARPCAFNGMFDFYTYRKLKGYFPFLMFSKLYKLGTSSLVKSDDDEIYVAAASDGVYQCAMVTYYSLDKMNADSKNVIIKVADGNVTGEWEYTMLDNEHTMERFVAVVDNGEIVIPMKPDSVLLLEKKMLACN